MTRARNSVKVTPEESPERLGMLRYATIYFSHSNALSVIRRTRSRESCSALRAVLAPTRAAVKTLAVMLLLLCGMAQAFAQTEPDPWEGYNRRMHNTNDGLDRYLVKPVAKGYDAIMPEAGRKGVNNFFKNFYDFNGVLNAVLQGRFEQALNNTFRVVTNTTVGVFGLFDVASKAGNAMLLSDAVRTAAFWFSDEICWAISLRRMRTDRGAEKPSLTVSPLISRTTTSMSSPICTPACDERVSTSISCLPLEVQLLAGRRLEQLVQWFVRSSLRRVARRDSR